MKKKQTVTTDLAFEFWKKYEKADLLDREKLLEPIIKNFPPIDKIKDEKLRKRVLMTYLRSYFDDLIDYFYCKEIKTKKIG